MLVNGTEEELARGPLGKMLLPNLKKKIATVFLPDLNTATKGVILGVVATLLVSGEKVKESQKAKFHPQNNNQLSKFFLHALRIFIC